MHNRSFVFLSVALSVVMLGAGCGTSPAASVNTSQSAQPTPAVTPSADKAYSLEDVAKHATQTDCWTTIGGKVYDLTSAVDKHPGGAEAIMKGCGKDGTSIFNGIKDGNGHPQKAQEGLQNLLVGILKQ